MKTLPLKPILFIVSLLPAVWLTYALLTDQLGANPIEVVTRESGLWALRFLWLTLMVTPMRWLFGWHSVARFRRMLGLYVFFYASVHMLLYLWLDQFFIVSEIINDIIKRPFITVGFISFIALIPLAITSTNRMLKRLGGKRWQKLHKLTYFIAVASALHFYMLVKQDKTEPIIYALILLGLLTIRFVYHYFPYQMAKKHG